MFFQFCPQMRKKRKNHHFVAYFEKFKKTSKFCRFSLNFSNFLAFFLPYIWTFVKMAYIGRKWKKLVFFLFILCSNMGIIRTTIYDFSALKKKKKIIEKNRKNTIIFSFCPQMMKKRKNRQKSSFSCILWKIWKKRQNFTCFPSIFRLFWLFFWHPTAKMKNLRKKKKTCFFVFPLRLGGV